MISSTESRIPGFTAAVSLYASKPSYRNTLRSLAMRSKTAWLRPALAPLDPFNCFRDCLEHTGPTSDLLPCINRCFERYSVTARL